jgi:hypothetical protein
MPKLLETETIWGSSDAPDRTSGGIPVSGEVVSMTAVSMAHGPGASALKTWSLRQHDDSRRRLVHVAACRPQREHLQHNFNVVPQVAEFTQGVV